MKESNPSPPHGKPQKLSGGGGPGNVGNPPPPSGKPKGAGPDNTTRSGPAKTPRTLSGRAIG